MNDHGLTALEYTRVREMVKACLQSPCGLAAAGDWQPTGEPVEVAGLLEETAQMAAFVAEEGEVALGSLVSLEEVLENARPRGAGLTSSEIMAVRGVCAVNRRCRSSLLPLKSRFPVLSSLAGELPGLKDLEKDINRVLDEEGEFLDDASENLSRIIRGIALVKEEITNLYRKLLMGGESKGIFQEDIVTTRQGRYVLMVKSQAKGRLPGIVHDQTDSGAAVYMEPQQAVGLNNRLMELTAEENREKKKLLRFLTDRIRESREALTASVSLLGELDLIQARASFGLKKGHVRPEFSRSGRIVIREGRHPVLEEVMKDGIVPLQLEIGDDIRALVITGPNTGGKTVVLKTIGLICLMAQSGLFVPAGEGTELPVYSDIFADIGDEQSVDQNLSTFSAHIKNIAEALGGADEKALIILDELGAGTDPGEGAHLGMAILESLLGIGCLSLASTHHEALCAFAASTPEVSNASMEFDGSTLRPTYRLVMGVPGRSNAKEIARQMGIPEKVVTRAGDLESESGLGVDQLLEDLNQRRREMETACREMAEREGELSSLIGEKKIELEELRREKEKIISEAREEAVAALGQARKRVKEIISETAGGGGQAHRRLHRLKEDLENALPDVKQRPSRPVKEPRIGQEVSLPHLPAPGRVIDINRAKGTVRLEVQGKVVSVPADKLEEAPERGSDRERPRRMSYGLESGEMASSMLDIRGLRADEAASRVEKFLDGACLAGLESVEILHGKGLGRLKNLVDELLEEHPGVKGGEPAASERGGHGVTVVKIK